MFFGEDQGRLRCDLKTRSASLIEKLNKHGVVGEQIGFTGGDSLRLCGYLDESWYRLLADLRAAHEGFFPKLMGGELRSEVMTAGYSGRRWRKS